MGRCALSPPLEGKAPKPYEPWTLSKRALVSSSRVPSSFRPPLSGTEAEVADDDDCEVSGSGADGGAFPPAPMDEGASLSDSSDKGDGSLPGQGAERGASSSEPLDEDETSRGPACSAFSARKALLTRSIFDLSRISSVATYPRC